VSSATEWVESNAASVAHKVMSVGDISKIFAGSNSWVQKGVRVASAALDCMKNLAAQMLSIFKQFEPLKAIFASKDGLMTLIKQPKDTATLVHVVRELCNTSSTLEALNGALHQVSGMFEEISEFFHNLLARIGMGGSKKSRLLSADARRLSSWTDLLRGIDFKHIVSTLKGYLRPLSSCTRSLLSISDVIGPMMIKMDDAFTSLNGGSKGNGRQLFGIEDAMNLKKNQEKYSKAIAQIIPSWQAAENLGVKMCPTVALSHSSASALKCRVSSFVKSTGISLGAISGLVSDCGGDPSSEAKKEAKNSKCPAAAHSAGLKNVLGENANMLGWILAAVVGLGLLGVGGGAVKTMAGGGGEEESGDDEEGDGDSEERELVE